MRNTRTFPCYYLNHSGKLIKVSTWWLQVMAAQNFEAARNAYQDTHPGQKMVIASAGRTRAEQVALKRLKPTLAATPGKSRHEAGAAVDITTGQMIGKGKFANQAALEAFMAQYHYYRTVKKEPWHFEFHPNWPARIEVTAEIRAIDNDQ